MWGSSIWPEKQRVRLTKDLTRYNKGLTVGQLGYTTTAQSGWARTNDNFVGVRFDCGACLDIAWSSLERVKEPQKESSDNISK